MSWLTAVNTEDFKGTITKRVAAIKALAQYLTSKNLKVTIAGLMSEDSKLLVQASKNPENYLMYFQAIASWLQQGSEAAGSTPEEFQWYLLDSDEQGNKAINGTCADTAQQGATRARSRSLQYSTHISSMVDTDSTNVLQAD